MVYLQQIVYYCTGLLFMSMTLSYYHLVKEKLIFPTKEQLLRNNLVLQKGFFTNCYQENINFSFGERFMIKTVYNSNKKVLFRVIRKEI